MEKHVSWITLLGGVQEKPLTTLGQTERESVYRPIGPAIAELLQHGQNFRHVQATMEAPPVGNVFYEHVRKWPASKQLQCLSDQARPPSSKALRQAGL